MNYADEDLGYLTYYYSSRQSNIPTRAVDRIGDNKRDPNLETRTYGVFTDCNCRGRKNVVRDGRKYLFFMTNFKNVRQVTGYYEIGWFHNVHCSISTKTVALKASRVHFVGSGIRFVGKPQRTIRHNDISDDEIRIFGPPRGCCRLDHKSVSKLLESLNGKEDISGHYVREIKKLETENLKDSGKYRYPSSHREETFRVKDIGAYLV